MTPSNDWKGSGNFKQNFLKIGVGKCSAQFAVAGANFRLPKHRKHAFAKHWTLAEVKQLLRSSGFVKLQKCITFKGFCLFCIPNWHPLVKTVCLWGAPGTGVCLVKVSYFGKHGRN